MASALVILSACTAADAPGMSTPERAELLADVSETVDQLDEYGKVRSVLVQEGEDLLVDLRLGDDADGYLNLRSVTKGVIATLIGIAIDHELITGLNASLGDLLPAYRDQMSPEVAAITLDAILTHTAGFVPDDDYGTAVDYRLSPDWVAAILADRVSRGFGDGRFRYSGAGSHILATILAEASGGSVLEFAQEHLFGPLGIESEPAWMEAETGTPEERAKLAGEYAAADFAWPTDPQGISQGDSQLKLRPDDMLALGELYLHGGEAGGNRVVSKEWIDASTVAHVELMGAGLDGYGYHWWVDHVGDDAMYLALGYAGNLLAVVPDRDLVVVIASEFVGLDPTETSEQFAVGDAIAVLEGAILPHIG